MLWFQWILLRLWLLFICFITTNNFRLQHFLWFNSFKKSWWFCINMIFLKSNSLLFDLHAKNGLRDFIMKWNSFNKLFFLFDNCIRIFWKCLSQKMRRNWDISHLFFWLKISENDSKECISSRCQSRNIQEFYSFLIAKNILSIIFIDLKFDLSKILHAFNIKDISTFH